MIIKTVICPIDGSNLLSAFDTKWEDPMSEPLETIFTEPHIKHPVKVIAVFDDGEIIVWSVDNG